VAYRPPAVAARFKLRSQRRKGSGGITDTRCRLSRALGSLSELGVHAAAHSDVPERVPRGLELVHHAVGLAHSADRINAVLDANVR
jgi:predicted amidohydrolase YtcJ